MTYVLFFLPEKTFYLLSLFCYNIFHSSCFSISFLFLQYQSVIPLRFFSYSFSPTHPTSLSYSRGLSVCMSVCLYSPLFLSIHFNVFFFIFILLSSYQSLNYTIYLSIYLSLLLFFCLRVFPPVLTGNLSLESE